jgi:hypothetical protein
MPPLGWVALPLRRASKPEIDTPSKTRRGTILAPGGWYDRFATTTNERPPQGTATARRAAVAPASTAPRSDTRGTDGRALSGRARNDVRHNAALLGHRTRAQARPSLPATNKQRRPTPGWRGRRPPLTAPCKRHGFVSAQVSGGSQRGTCKARDSSPLTGRAGPPTPGPERADLES